jgi:hypothetical protein
LLHKSSLALQLKILYAFKREPHARSETNPASPLWTLVARLVDKSL